MSIFGADFEAYLRTPERRGLSDSALQQHLGDIWAPSSAGIPVSQTTALGLPTFWHAVFNIATNVARPRVRPFTLSANDTRRYEDGHPVGRLLNMVPNPHMTSITFRQVVTAHVLIYGNGYAEIEWDNAGRARALWPLIPTEVEPVMRGGELVYLVRGQDTGLRGADVLHIKGLGFDGLRGYSVLSMARQSIGLGLAAQQFGATFFGNGAFPGLVASTEQSLNLEARERIRDSWQAMHKGPDKAHRMAILEGGLKVEKLTIPPDDAQFLETRQFQREEICAYFNIAPAMLGYGLGAGPGGYSEMQKVSYVSDTIGPWWRAWEQEVERKLLSPGPRQVEHDAEELLQFLSMNETRLMNKATAAKTLIDAGANPEDVMDVCGLPPIRFAKPEPAPPPPPPPADPEDDSAAVEAQRALLVHAVGLMVRIEAGEARRAAEKGRLKEWAEEFYPRHQVRLMQALEPVIRAVRPRGDWKAAAAAVAARMVECSRGDLRGVVEAGAVDLVASRWELERPSEVAVRVMEEKA
jgi:HK97 family phage portal protein